MSDVTKDAPAGGLAEPSSADPARSDPAMSLVATASSGQPAVGLPDPTRTSRPDPTQTSQSDAAATTAAPPDALPAAVPQVRNPARYRLLGEHGRGGLGKVSRAHDLELGRDVAIKELLSRGALHEVRFLREALITARLEHPGIVPVHEAGRWPDGTPFYAMKLVAGRPLRDLLAERKTVDQRIALLHHVIAVADAIAYAHGRRIVHRDLKPGNVIVGEFGETVVIDWGLAKELSTGEEVTPGGGAARAGRDDDLTSTGAVLGTPAYMAPEQQRGESVDQRADVYAIGAMLWELCALERLPPGDGGQRRRILRASGIDPDLAAIIDKAIAPDPDRRYPDAGALAADLKAFKVGARIAARSYSSWATLARWTRRHRALALSVAAVLALAAAGAGLYVRNIAAERDRADAALITARLSEASLLLEKDPTAARDLLAALPVRSPRHALLTSMARQLAATHVVALPDTLTGLFRAPGSAALELTTNDGGFHRVDPATWNLETLDHGLTGAVTYRAGEVLYGRKSPGGGAVRIASPARPDVFGVELTGISQLSALDDAVYALDAAGDLHRLDGKTAAVVDHGVRSLVGGGTVRMMCKATDELAIDDGGQAVLRDHCPATKSPGGMAVARAGYAALTAEHTLVMVRAGRRTDLPTPIRGEYELAMSDTGLIAMADYETSTTWFVRGDGAGLEAGPVYASQLYCVAVDGDLAAWGYGDGVTIVLDTRTGTVWKLRGYNGTIGFLAVDAANDRVVAGQPSELRSWDLRRPAIARVTTTPCVIFHIEPSPTGELVGADCNDGSVRVWSRGDGAVQRVPAHAGSSFRVQWLDGKICSGGMEDGRVLCSNPDGTELQTITTGANRISWLISGIDHRSLIFASGDGKVWSYDRALHELYMQRGVFRLAISDDGRYLASCAVDGSLTVYDVMDRRLIAQVPDHAVAANDVAWLGHDVWTAGNDGAIHRWVVRDGALSARGGLRTSGRVQRLRPVQGGLAASAGTGILVIRPDAQVAFRLDAHKAVGALEVSPDRRHVAVVVGSDIVVIDVVQDAIATVMVGAPEPRQLRFVDATTLAFSEIFALETVRIDKLDYAPFDRAATP